MGSETDRNALSYMDPKEFQIANLSLVYYCSFVDVGFINHSAVYRFHEISDLEDVHALCKAKNIFVDLFVWLAIALGLPGNIVALITVLTMPQNTGTFYIALLSVSDLIALCTRACSSLFFRYKLYYPEHLCWFMHFITNYSVTYANWVLVFICLERFITIRFPLKKSYYFTLKRAYYSAAILAVILLPVFFTFFFLTEASGGICIPTSGMTFFYTKIFSRIVEALYSFIPAALLLLFTVMVMIELKRHQKARKLLFSDQPSGGEVNANLNQSRTEMTHSRKRRQETESLGKNLTIMMMFTAFVFLILTVPLCVTMIVVLNNKSSRLTNVAYARNELLWHAVASINLMSHAINFYIYFLSARKFRRHMCFLLNCKKNMRPQLPSFASKTTRL